MNSGRHIDRWLSGLLAAVCVLLVRNLVGEVKSSILPLYRRPAVAAAPRSVPKISPAAATQERGRAQGFKRLHSSTLAEADCGAGAPDSARQPFSGRVGRLTDCLGLTGPGRSRPTVTPTTRPPIPVGAGMPPTITTASTSSPDLAAAQVPGKPTPPQDTASAPPQPAVSVLQPIGYVEDGDGHREAVVPDGDHVRIVHEGDAYGEHAQIVKITPSAIEIAELSPQPSISSGVTLAGRIGEEPSTAPVSHSAPHRIAPQPIIPPPITVVASKPQPGPKCCPSLNVAPRYIAAGAGLPASPSVGGSGGRRGQVPAGARTDAAPPFRAAGAGLKPGATTPATLAGHGGKPSQASPRQQVAAEADTEWLGYVEKSGGERDEIIAVGGAVKLIPKTGLQNRDFQVRADRALSAAVADLPRDLALTSRPSWPVSKSDGEPYTRLEPEALSIPMPWSAQPSEAFLAGRTSGSDPPVTPPDSWQRFPPANSRSGPSAVGPPGEASLPKPDPEVVTNLPTLGYAQMADGQVVAILPEGESVRLVRQGEALGDGVKVAQVYQTSIDIAHLPDPRATPLVARDRYNVGESPATDGLRDLQLRQSSLALGRAGAGRNLEPSGITIVEKAETKPLRLWEQVNAGCGDEDPDIPQEAAQGVLESPEDLANSADGAREFAVADADQPDGAVTVEHMGLNATDAGQFPLPVEIAKDLYQRPPPGILPFEDVEASPGHLAPGDGQVRLPDALSQPTALEGNSGKAHPGPCSRRKQ